MTYLWTNFFKKLLPHFTIELRAASNLCQQHVHNVAFHLLNNITITWNDDDSYYNVKELNWGKAIRRMEGLIASELFLYDGVNLTQTVSSFHLVPDEDRFVGSLSRKELTVPQPQPQYPALSRTQFAIMRVGYEEEEVLVILMRTLYPVLLWYTYSSRHKKVLALERIRTHLALLSHERDKRSLKDLLNSLIYKSN